MPFRGPVAPPRQASGIPSAITLPPLSLHDGSLYGEHRFPGHHPIGFRKAPPASVSSSGKRLSLAPRPGYLGRSSHVIGVRHAATGAKHGPRSRGEESPEGTEGGASRRGRRSAGEAQPSKRSRRGGRIRPSRSPVRQRRKSHVPGPRRGARSLPREPREEPRTAGGAAPAKRSRASVADVEAASGRVARRCAKGADPAQARATCPK